MSFHIGEKVKISKSSEIPMIRGQVGTIVKYGGILWDEQQYGIRIEGLPNTYSKDRLFYVREHELLYTVTENDINDALTYSMIIKHYIPEPVTVIFPEIKDVIFNPPATIIKWSDGTKTVVKASNEEFDPEKGFAMAIAKKAFGNVGHYYETFKKWIPEEKKEEPKATVRYGKVKEVTLCDDGVSVEVEFEHNEEGMKIFSKLKEKHNLITYREYAEKVDPFRIDGACGGGVVGCPSMVVVGAPDCDILRCFTSDKACAECWNKIIPPGAIDKTTGKPVYNGY